LNPLISAADRAGIGVSGRLQLRFDCLDGQTVLNVVEQTAPLKVVRAFRQESGAALLHLHNVSGGILGGDRLDYHIDLGADTEAQVTTTSATRVYRRRAQTPPAVQSTTIRVGSGALLELLPDPVIPFAGSAYRQETHITLDDRAGLFWWELLAPGRIARGEVFEYDSLELLTSIYAADRPIALEHSLLEPKQRPLTSAVRLGGNLYFATFIVCKTDVLPDRWLALEGQLRLLAGELSAVPGMIWGVSTLPACGLVVRGMGAQGRSLTSGLLGFWQAARQVLYGRAAVPPRKIY